MRPNRDVTHTVLWSPLALLLPALAMAQGQSTDPPLGQPGAEVSPVWWVILAIFAAVLIWAIVRAQRRGGAAGS